MRLPYQHHCVTSLIAFTIAAGSGFAVHSVHAQSCQLPEGAVRPNPADGMSGVGIDPLLQWNGDCIELVTHGGFESQLAGWSTTASGGGAFVATNGSFDPPGPGTAAQFLACEGIWSALSAPTAGGTQTLFQDIMIPSGPTATITLQWDHKIRNQGAVFSDPSQEYRVEIRDTSDVVLATAYSTDPGDTLLEDNCSTHTFDLTPYIGQEIRIAFVVQSDITFLNVQIDNVSVQVCDGSLMGGMAAAAPAATDSRKLGVGDAWPGDPYRTVVVGPEANVDEPTEAQVYVGDPDNSPLLNTLVDMCTPVAFPSGFSTINASVGVLPDQPPQIGYFFSANVGHSVEQTFNLPESTYDQFVFDFFIPMNILAPGSTVEWDVEVQDVTIGSFSVVPDQTGAVHLEFTHDIFGTPSGGGFDYKIRFEVTNNAASGSHSLGIASPVAGSVQISKRRYEILLDTVNPPQKVLAQDLEDPIFDIPGSLLQNETYYWQVITKDCCGDVPGPVWSFNTSCPETVPPTNPSPVSEQAQVTTSPLLEWSNTSCNTVFYAAATTTSSEDSPSSLFRVDPQTASASFIGPIGFSGVSGMAYSSSNGKLYGTCIDPNDTAQALLIEIDPLTGAGTSIGQVNTGGSGQMRVHDLSFRSDGTLFGYGKTPDQLITLNLNTGAGSLVGSTGFNGMGNGLAFSSDGTLFAAPDDGGSSNCLVTLDTGTGAGACIPGSENDVPSFIRAMAFCFDSGEMLGAWRNGGVHRLVRLNLDTGVDTTLGFFSGSLGVVDALAFIDDCTTTYDVYLDTNESPTTLIANDVPTLFLDVEAEIGALNPTTTYFWKVVANNCCGSAESEVWSFTTCAAPETPSNPTPIDTAIDQSTDMTLAWDGGGECSPTYDILFDTVSPPVEVLAQDVASPTFNIAGTLSPGETYYWQVIAKNPAGNVPGPIWSFSTACPSAVAGNPSPGILMTGIPVSPVLTWNNNSCDAVLYAAATGTASADDPSSLYRVNPQNAAMTFIGPIGFKGVTGLAFSPSNKKLYGTCNDPSDSSHSLLIEINVLSGAGTAIGRVDTGGNGQRRVCDISFRSDGTLFGYGENPHQLITLNLGTGAGSLVGSTGFIGVGNGIAFGPDGTLYGTPGTNVNDCLVTLDTGTGAGTCIAGSEGNVPFFVNAMAYCFGSQTMFGVWSDNGTPRLRTIDLETGVDTAVGTLSVPGVDALAFIDDCNPTYDVILDKMLMPTTLVAEDLVLARLDLESAIGPLDPGSTYRWRIITNTCCGSVQGPVWSFTTCALPNPNTPTPVHAAQDQPTDMTLSWQNVNECSPTYDILFDTVSPPTKVLAEDLTATTFDILGTLSPGQTYYWQVVGENSSGQSASPIWSFTTACLDPATPGNPSPPTLQTSVSVSPVLTWNTPSCDAVLYGAATGSSNVDGASSLYSINTQTAAMSLIGPIGFNGVTGLAWSPINQKLYGTCNDPADANHAMLIEVNPWNGVGTAIGRVDTGGNGQRRVCDISFRSDGTLFGYGENPHQLITMNLGTGAGSLIGSTGFIGVGNGIAFGADGTLFGTPGNIVDDCLVTLNTSTGAGTCIAGSEGNVPFFINAMAYCFGGETMYGAWNSNPGTGQTRLRTIDLSTGQDSAVGTFPVAGVNALAFIDDCNTTYDVYLDTSLTPTTLVGNDVNVASFDVGATIGALNPNTTYRWRIVANNCCGSVEGPVWSFTTCTASNTPSTPVPADGAQDQPLSQSLSWTGGGACAPTYDVLLDTVNPPVAAVCSDISDTQCLTGTLTIDTTYYWRVISKGPGGIVEGPVWSFETGSSTTVPADTDADGDVDGVDFAQFAACFNKAGNPPRTFGCDANAQEALDFDKDDDIDGVDFASFAACFNKSGNPPRTLGCPTN